MRPMASTKFSVILLPGPLPLRGAVIWVTKPRQILRNSSYKCILNKHKYSINTSDHMVLQLVFHCRKIHAVTFTVPLRLITTLGISSFVSGK